MQLRWELDVYFVTWQITFIKTKKNTRSMVLIFNLHQ